MGWSGAVDIQCFIRRFVFGICKVPANLEMLRNRSLAQDEIAITCLDGVDIVRKLQDVASSLQNNLFVPTSEGGLQLPYMQAFIKECEKRKLPLNIGKSVVRQFTSRILGGELLGLDGVRSHARKKRLEAHRQECCCLIRARSRMLCSPALGWPPLVSVQLQAPTLFDWAGNLHGDYQSCRLAK